MATIITCQTKTAEDKIDSEVESLLAEAAFIMNHASEFVLEDEPVETVAEAAVETLELVEA